MNPRALLIGTIALVMLLGSCRDTGYESDSIRSATPEMREYVLAVQRAYYNMARVKSFRKEMDQPRNGGMMHSVQEFSCPDRYHTRSTGAVAYERYVIGDQMYERKGSAEWTQLGLKGPIADLTPCRPSSYSTRTRPPDEADVELLLPNYASIQVAKLDIETYHGRKCQKFSVRWTDGPTNSECLAVDGDVFPIHSEWNGTTWTMYDINQPIDIRAPHLK